MNAKHIDIDGNEVKVGTRLVCVDDAASFRRLQVGQEYTAEAAYDGSPTVIVRGAYHSLDRFRVLKGEGHIAVGASRAISVPGGSPGESLTVPTDLIAAKTNRVNQDDLFAPSSGTETQR